MEGRKQLYTFDIILESCTLHPPGDNLGFDYQIRLFKDTLHLTEDRYFIPEFPTTPYGVIETKPCDLTLSLGTYGISVSLSRDEELLGAGCGVPSLDLLKALAEPTFSVEEQVLVDLRESGKKVGNLKLRIKLTSTGDPIDTRLLSFGCYDICRPTDKSINPRDFILTFGRCDKCSTVSCITDQRLISHEEPLFDCLAKLKPPTQVNCSCEAPGAMPLTDPSLDPSKGCERALLRRLLVEIGYDKMTIPKPPLTHELSRHFHARRRCCRRE